MLTAFQCPECGSHTVVDAALSEVTCGSCGTTSAQEARGQVYRPPPPPPRAPQPVAELQPVEMDVNTMFAQQRPPPPPVRPMVAQPQPQQYVTPTAGAGARKGAAFAVLIVFGVLGAGVWAAIRSQKQAAVPAAQPAVAQKAEVETVGPFQWRHSGPPVLATVGDRQLLLGRIEQGSGYWIGAFTLAGELVWRANTENATRMIPIGSLLVIERGDGTVVALDLATGAHRMEVTSSEQLDGECGGNVGACLSAYRRANPLSQMQVAADARDVPRVRQVEVEWFAVNGDDVLALGTETRGDHRQVMVLARDSKIVWKRARPGSEGYRPPAVEFVGDGMVFVAPASDTATVMRLDPREGGVVWSRVIGDPSDPYQEIYLADGLLFGVSRDRLLVIDVGSGEIAQIGN